MNNQNIDHLTEKFYKSISFNTEQYPNFDLLQELFYGDGRLIDNNFDEPINFTVKSFVHALMHQIEVGNITFLVQQEISDTTEIFGKIAQRISIYEYSSTTDYTLPWKKGVNYIQYIFTEGRWFITSMIWSDEEEEVPIPEVYLDY